MCFQRYPLRQDPAVEATEVLVVRVVPVAAATRWAVFPASEALADPGEPAGPVAAVSSSVDRVATVVTVVPAARVDFPTAMADPAASVERVAPGVTAVSSAERVAPEALVVPVGLLADLTARPEPAGPAV